MTDDEKLAILDKHVRELSELYDAVQIVVTWLDPGGRTRSQKRGSGNWYARRSLCQEFITEDAHDDQAKAIARHLDPPDEWKKQA